MDNWDTTVFKRPRFMSEFGLQSWPSASTLSKFFPVDQQFWASDLMTNRNHHPDGQNQILEQIAAHFHLPPTAKVQGTRDSYISWSHFLYLSQINQAYGYKVEVEHFRRSRTQCTADVPGCTMGMMYWQTNDIWPGASWAAIDYTGRYKMVQYYTQRFYSPFLVSPLQIHGRSFETWIINVSCTTQLASASGPQPEGFLLS